MYHLLSLSELPEAKSLGSLGKKVMCLAQGTGQVKCLLVDAKGWEWGSGHAESQ